MQKIEAQFEIVTPMFIGGADKQEPPEIRPPSIKGALRFWWRALQWGACLKATASEDQALQLLHKQEAELFGAAFKDGNYGQGNVLLKVKNLPSKPENMSKFSSGQQYLLGQGLYHFRNGLLQTALASKQHFNVILILNKNIDAQSAQSVIDALMLFGLLGGLGSRARKGWGSVAIQSLMLTDKENKSQNIPVPDNKESYTKTISAILSNLPQTLPPFSAFSSQTRIDLSTTTSKLPESLLTEIGEQMQMYRSYGRNGGSGHKVNGKDAEQNFKIDHDLILDFAQGQHVSEHPKRTVFGLPHNYFYSNGTKVDVDAEAEQGKSSRRASPLIIHIHRFLSGESIAVHTLLKADFLPEGRRVQLKKGHKTQMLKCDVDWTVVTDYLERFKQGERII